MAALAPARALAQALEALGARGALGLGLLAFAAAFHLGTVQPAQVELAQLEQLRTKLESARASQPREASVAPEQQLAEFHATLPSVTGMEAAAEQIFDIGKRLGVTLRQGGYRLLREEGSQLARYEINYLAQAEYFRVRLMLRELVKEMPALSLDAIAMQRQQAASPSVELTLRVSLHVRQD